MVPTRPSVATGIPVSKAKYLKISSTDDRHVKLQKKTLTFKKSPPKIPYKAIACATVQFLIGSFLVITGCLLLAGYISEVGAHRAVPVLVIGMLVFLPGSYHLFIAYGAYRGCQGYSYDDLPDCDN
ncbi:transmembrane protein 230-like [Eulemur rufifrons]|uniref:transmembrane protein 230-like n=1 Tax=Eulemur rufifrons TaxID=859984 RepID=UPI00374499FC